MEPDTSGVPARVLLVDDFEDARETVGDYLGFLGYHVTMAATVDMAVVRLAEKPFDIVITDVEMPGRSGIDLIAIIRSGEDQRIDRSNGRAAVQPANRRVPIIVASGHFKLNLTGVPAEFLEQVEVVSKPILPDALLSLMKKMLDQRRTRLHEDEDR